MRVNKALFIVMFMFKDRADKKNISQVITVYLVTETNNYGTPHLQ